VSRRVLHMGKDLFNEDKASKDYTADSIRVLKGLEAVRMRPGMYIGGTDERALHHLVAEVLDNSMDEAVAGHANRIEVELNADYSVTIRDNGRGIPIDPHPDYPEKSALEVILCELHSGGKFDGKAYQTSGGLHGVGISVVNALSDSVVVEVARSKKLYRQSFSRGIPLGKIEDLGPTQNRRGTTVTFHPDAEIFGSKLKFKPARMLNMTRSKAYLFSGVEIRWKCAPELITDDTPAQAGSVEWAINWTPQRDAFVQSYCNTVPTPEGGTHETGFWAAILKGIKAYGELASNKKAASITREDVMSGGCSMISVFIREPEFVGQTKDRLATVEAQKLRKSATKKLRLPGKLVDCSQSAREGTELFIVEGDSAGGSAKMGRNRKTQALLPLRGKILNVLGAASNKLNSNQELSDLSQALGVATGTKFDISDLRYDKVIIMTDADVDGAHISALLMTFFFTQMRPLIDGGHLYLAQPPLFKLVQGAKREYCMGEDEKNLLLEKGIGGRGKIDVSRFKGLGEMNANDLKETTMDPATRSLIQVQIDEDEPGETSDLVERLMGKKPELRYEYIQENAKFVEELDV